MNLNDQLHPPSMIFQVRFAAKYVWPALAILFIALNTKDSASGDLWFLLLAGKFALEHGQIPHHEFFMYTAMGKPEVFGGWGYGLLMEVTKQSFGIPAMYFLNAGLWSTVFLTAIAALRVRLGKPWLSSFSLAEIACIILSSYIIYNSIVSRTMMRPEVTMYAIWSIGMLLFEIGHRRGNFTQAQWIFPLLLWLETWLHTAGILLLLLPAIYATEDFTNRLFRQQLTMRAYLPLLLRWIACLLACAVLPIFNPNGAAQIYLHLVNMLPTANAELWVWFTTVTGIAELPLQHLTPIANITEYSPAWLATRALDELKLLSGFTFVLLMTGERRIFSFACLIPLACLGALHFRGLGVWALALFVPLASLLVKTGEQIATLLTMRRATQTTGLILLLSCLALLRLGYLSNGLRWPENRLPLTEGTAAIRTAYPEGGNVFCSYVICAPAAYVLGEKYKVPIAGHIMFLWPETKTHFNGVLHGRADWQEQFDRNSVVAAIIEPYYPVRADLSAIGLNLAHSPDWRLVAIEHEAMSFVRLQTDAPRLTPNEQLVQIKRFWQTAASAADKLTDLPLPETARQAKSKANAMVKLIKLYANSPEVGIDLMHRHKDEILAAQLNAALQ